jgi:hypothetical protein
LERTAPANGLATIYAVIIAQNGQGKPDAICDAKPASPQRSILQKTAGEKVREFHVFQSYSVGVSVSCPLSLLSTRRHASTSALWNVAEQFLRNGKSAASKRSATCFLLRSEECLGSPVCRVILF